MKTQKGFTLIELAVTVLVIGVMSLVLAPIFSALTASQRGAYTANQKIDNQTIDAALLSFAQSSTLLGTLPNPYTGAGYTSTVYNPGDTSTGGMALTAALTQAGISPGEINNDGYASHRVRVYQTVPGFLTQTIPLYFQSGPLLTVRYQFGAIYMTNCAYSDTACNPAPTTGIPGASIALTAGNYTTWTTTGTDLVPFFISSLPLQKQMLASTAQRLDQVRAALLSYFRAQQVTAAAGDTTNWYPPSGTYDTMGGQTPSTNQGCRDGWYDLSTNLSILPIVGLTLAEYGATAWGGPVQYCRDYDPTGTKAPNASPHYAAIRINLNVSQGIAPDGVVLGNNVVLTM